MGGAHFHLDGRATLIAAIFWGVFLFLRWKREPLRPHLKFSAVAPLLLSAGGLRARFIKLPHRLYLLSLAFFTIAFIDPHLLIERLPEQKPEASQAMKEKEKPEELTVPVEGIGIYLVVDRSPSMEKVVSQMEEGRPKRVSRLDVLKNITAKFVKGDPTLALPGRRGDMVGLVTFARTAEVVSPLTLDTDFVVNKLASLKAVSRSDQEGTAIGYAIFKTANLIAATKHFAQDLIKEGKPSYDIKNTIIVLVTDGFQTINPDDTGHPLRAMSVSEAAQVAKEMNIKLYIINVEPAILYSEFNAQRKELKAAAEATGGQLYIAGQGNSLQTIYQEIDRLEKGKLPEGLRIEGTVEERAKAADALKYRRLSLYPYFIAVGLVFLMASMILETTLLRRVP